MQEKQNGSTIEVYMGFNHYDAEEQTPYSQQDEEYRDKQELQLHILYSPIDIMCQQHGWTLFQIGRVCAEGLCVCVCVYGWYEKF